MIGGGENRTLVLSKLHINHYMLSVLKISDPYAEHATRTGWSQLISVRAPERPMGAITILSTLSTDPKSLRLDLG